MRQRQGGNSTRDTHVAAGPRLNRAASAVPVHTPSISHQLVAVGQVQASGPHGRRMLLRRLCLHRLQGWSCRGERLLLPIHKLWRWKRWKRGTRAGSAQHGWHAGRAARRRRGRRGQQRSALLPAPSSSLCVISVAAGAALRDGGSCLVALQRGGGRHLAPVGPRLQQQPLAVPRVCVGGGCGRGAGRRCIGRLLGCFLTCPCRRRPNAARV
jgi:hypothetical protein